MEELLIKFLKHIELYKEVYESENWTKEEISRTWINSQRALINCDIEEMFPIENVELARPTRPENRILAYNARQRDRIEGAKRFFNLPKQN